MVRIQAIPRMAWSSPIANASAMTIAQRHREQRVEAVFCIACQNRASTSSSRKLSSPTHSGGVSRSQSVKLMAKGGEDRARREDRESDQRGRQEQPRPAPLGCRAASAALSPSARSCETPSATGAPAIRMPILRGGGKLVDYCCWAARIPSRAGSTVSIASRTVLLGALNTLVSSSSWSAVVHSV